MTSTTQAMSQAGTQTYFSELVDHVQHQLRGSEVFLAYFGAEDSDFVRLNHNRVRQAGHVVQRSLGLELIDGRRQASTHLTLSGDAETDRGRIDQELRAARERLPFLPEDPYLLYSTEPKSSETIGENRLPSRDQAIGTVVEAAGNKDLVGIYAAGGIHRGFANSMGQRNWFTSHSFNLDWSLYHQTDKAVKTGYAGLEWSDDEFRMRHSASEEQLAVLSQTPRTIDPGKYRVYLSPIALFDIVDTLSWGSFGLKHQRTKQSPLLRMVEEGVTLSPRVTLLENTAEGVGPNFQGEGFIKPPSVSLIEGGCFRNCLTSPRSAMEYAVATNGASDDESPHSIELGPGGLPRSGVLESLGTGLYINNLWYLNYSDRPAARITGMTRFATLWVENGKIVAPVNVMRFDESVYRVLGKNLVDLTRERDLILDPGTYGGRSTHSARLPGALVEDFTLTL